MPRRFTLNPALALPAALLLLAAAQAPAHAGLVTTVTPTVTAGVGGLTDYSYLVTNSATSTAGVQEFDLAVYSGATLSNIMNPTGFLALYTAGDSFIQFLSTDPSTDIAPGSSGVFSFSADTGPDTGSFLTQGTDAAGASVQGAGTTLAPTATPEPSTLVLAAAGALVLFGRPAHRRLTGPKAR